MSIVGLGVVNSMIGKRALAICPVLMIALTSASAARADECPVILKSLLSAGQAASHSFASYEVRVESAKARKISSIQVALKLADKGAVDTTMWHDVTITAPKDLSGDRPSATGTFDREKADVVAAAIDRVVTSDGQPAIVCDQTWVGIDPPADVRHYLTVIDDKTHAFDPQIKSHQFVDAHFTHLVGPKLTFFGDTEDDATIRVTVTDSGKPSRAVITESSQNDYFDDAALDAVRNSSFSQPLLDGKPVPKDFLVFFSMTNNPGFRPLKPMPLSCVMAIDSFRLANAGQPDALDWLEVGTLATRPDIVSAVVGLQEPSGDVIIRQWTNVTVPQTASTEKPEHASALFTWTGPVPVKAFIESVTYADGKHYGCFLHYDDIDVSLATAKLPRTAKVPSKPGGVFDLSQDPPIEAIYPTYPAAALASGVTGRIGVDVFVDDAGTAVGGFIERSSSDPTLDQAALTAAMQGRYLPLQQAAFDYLRAYYVEFEFADRPS